MRKILVIDGHPDPKSLCAALATEYEKHARQAGAAVQILRLRDLEFDVHLRRGVQQSQAPEPDIQAARQAILDADHITLVSPVWWGSITALLKGFLDRSLERGWAYRYSDRGIPQGLLKGRTGRVVITTDSPGWYLRLVKGDTTARQLVRSTLRFCGVRPVKVTRFGPVHSSTMEKRTRWIAAAGDAGRKDAVGTANADKAMPPLPLAVASRP